MVLSALLNLKALRKILKCHLKEGLLSSAADKWQSQRRGSRCVNVETELFILSDFKCLPLL